MRIFVLILIFLYVAFGQNKTTNVVILKVKDETNSLSFSDFLKNFLDKYQDAKVKYEYESFHGYAIIMPPSGNQNAVDALEFLRSNEDVEYADYELIGRQLDVQQDAPWNLARISQRQLQSLDYHYDSNAGFDVDIYIVDSGVRRTHVDFERRVIYEAVFTGETSAPKNGHGTHVAGIAAGKTYGVAKKANIFSVRVVDNEGYVTESDAIAGLEWAIMEKISRNKPSIINMSWGMGLSSSLHWAVQKARYYNFVLVAAAGNLDIDACSTYPAAFTEVLSIGASDPWDSRYGAFGSCVDIFAPGVSITSDWVTSDTAVLTMSGTSMATPHVAGAAALMLADNTGYKVWTVETNLKFAATVGVIDDVGYESPNKLLYNNPPSSIIDKKIIIQ